MNKIYTADKIDRLKEVLTKEKNIVIVSHKSPDGDSMGSSLGLYHFLKSKGYRVDCCHPDVSPSFLHWMPGKNEIYLLEDNTEVTSKKISEADIIFCLDFHHPNRTGKMEDLLVKAKAFKVVIDHHRDPDQNFASLLFSDITASSTSQLVYELIEALNETTDLNYDSKSCLYAGIVTDTGSFRFSSTSASTHEIVSKLIASGLKTWEIHEKIYDTNSLNKIKMTSYAMLEKLVIFKEFETAYIWLTKEEEDRFGIVKGDTEGLVNQILGIEGIKMSGFFKESDGIIKISFRSKGEIPVNILCNQHFEGGGHLNASGGKFNGKIQDAIQKFVTILPDFVKTYQDKFK